MKEGIEMKHYKKVAIEHVTLENVDMTSDDLQGVDEQIRCVLGDIETAFNTKQYTEFEIIIRGK